MTRALHAVGVAALALLIFAAFAALMAWIGSQDRCDRLYQACLVGGGSACEAVLEACYEADRR